MEKKAKTTKKRIKSTKKTSNYLSKEEKDEIRDKAEAVSLAKRRKQNTEDFKKGDHNWFRVSSLSATDYAERKFMGTTGIGDPFIEKNFGPEVSKHVPVNWTPRMKLQPQNIQYSKGQITINKPFTAAEIKKEKYHPEIKNMSISSAFMAAKSARGSKAAFIWPKYWLNPYQYQDYIILQDIYANTIAGRIIDTLVFFMLGKGVKPKLIIKNKHKYANDQERQDVLAKYQWLIDAVEEIEANISMSGQPRDFSNLADGNIDMTYIPTYGYTTAAPGQATYDTSLQQKWAAIATYALVFARAMAIPRIDPQDQKVKVMIDKEEFEFTNIPKILLPIHPRDTGFNHIDTNSWKLLGIQLYNSNWVVKMDQCYFWEWGPHNPVYGSMYYGISAIQSMMGSARTERRIIEVDFPLIAKSRWSGMYWIFFKRKGEGLSTAQAELSSILSNITLEGINVSLEDDPMTDVRVEKIDLDPKIDGLLKMVEFLIFNMMAQVGMPQGLVYGEKDLNRDTFAKKVGAWTKGAVQKYRRWFLEPLTFQHYRRLVKTMAKQNTKVEAALKEVEIIATVEEFRLEDWPEMIDAVMKLSNLIPGSALKDDAMGEKLNLDEFESLFEKGKEPPEMPGGKGEYEVTEKGENRTFGVNTKK